MRTIGHEESQSIMMRILDEVVRVCDENGFRYSLAYGTLLGAVRHKGFIPWDDDIDIFLMRKDYDKLIRILKERKSNTADWISVVDDTCKGYYYSFAKIVDNRTEVHMDRHEGNHGLWIDIFPLDNMPKSDFGAKTYIMICSFLRVVALSLDTNFSSKTLSTWVLLYKRFFKVLGTIFGKKRFCRFMEWFFHLYENKETDKIANLFTSYKFKGIFDKKKLSTLIKLPFENTEYSGFENYDYYLSRLYGDYMKLPPEDKRITHNINAWWKE